MISNYKKRGVFDKKDLRSYVEAETKRHVTEISDIARLDGAKQMFSVCLYTLYLQYGFGKKRSQKFFDDVSSTFNLLQTGLCGKEMTINDCHKFCKDKLGVDVDQIRDR